MQEPWIHSPTFEAQWSQKQFDSKLKTQALEFHHQGLTRFKNMIPASFCEEVLKETLPLYETSPNSNLNQSRIRNAWEESAQARALAVYPPILNLLELFYQRRPIPFQTLNFKKTSQRPAHADAIQFSSLPAGYMCGVWVALEDIGPSQGPLFYYPRSHKLKDIDLNDIPAHPKLSAHDLYSQYMEAWLRRENISPQTVEAQKGDVIFWASGLVHGGSRATDPLKTRHSQVTHYYFEDCIYYNSLFSERWKGKYHLTPIRNLKNNQPVTATFNGNRPRSFHAGGGMHYVQIPSSTPVVLSLAERIKKSWAYTQHLFKRKTFTHDPA